MFCRFIAAAVILFSATLPASAITLKNVDPTLAVAAERMKVKDFQGAHDAALKSSEKGARAFLLGMSSIKLELWEEAASQLATAAESYPLLADYALYNQGLALSKLGRADQALLPLYKLVKEYPDSRLLRPALSLYGDTMAAAGHPKEALDVYMLFIERYPSGSDSISALFGSALCREKLGDPKSAATTLRAVWLNYPASPLAEKAAAELQRLAAAGTPVDPYTSAELFKRGNTLGDVGRYKQAADAYAAISLAGESEEFAQKVRLKMGQAQLKARRYHDAQATLKEVVQKGAGSSAAQEASYNLGKVLDKMGKPDEAFDLYLKLAENKRSAVADDALREAAYVRRFQRKWAEAAQLFRRYLTEHPEQKTSSVLWDTAWSSYQSRDYQAAATTLRKLAERDEMREKALYWLGKSLIATGDANGAEAAFAALAAEYPFGYYTLLCNRWCEQSAFPSPPKSLTEALPMPAGYEREKALIAFGLYDEAVRELKARKAKNTFGIARLYLEMGNYNGAYHTMASEKLKRNGTDSTSVWGLNYPLAYRDDVAKNAVANALPESLVYAIMRSESNYLPSALSPVGAVGLMQIMPATAETISKGDGSRLTRPELNIKLGTKHLRDLLVQHDNNLTLVIAAYNAGSGNVRKWQKALGNLPKDEFVESIPFGETREYVKKVVTAMELYQRLYRLPESKLKGHEVIRKAEPNQESTPAPQAPQAPQESPQAPQESPQSQQSPQKQG